MRNAKKYVQLFVVGVLLAGCGTDRPNSNGSNIEPEIPSEAEVIQGRKLLVALEQTTKETPTRDEKFEALKEHDILKMYGKYNPNLLEELSVQAIEGEAGRVAINKVYGDFTKIGVQFMGNLEKDIPLGLWIGIKNPDERVEELAKILQENVDKGEILAKYIHIFESPVSEQDTFDLMTKASSTANRFKRQHPNNRVATLGVSVSPITGHIVIGHNFFTDEMKENLRKQIPDQTIEFHLEGRFVTDKKEPDISYPKSKYTNTPSKEGLYIVSIKSDEFLAISPIPEDYSSTGGTPKHYDAMYYGYPDASKKLEVGQRVKVEGVGPTLASYPGIGGARFVEVLPEYKPDKAVLSESQVVQKVVAETEGRFGYIIIRFVEFDETSKTWTVGIIANDKEEEFTIKDE